MNAFTTSRQRVVFRTYRARPIAIFPDVNGSGDGEIVYVDSEGDINEGDIEWMRRLRPAPSHVYKDLLSKLEDMGLELEIIGRIPV